MKDFKEFAQKLDYVRRARIEYPEEIKEGGKYEKWFIRTRKELADEANRLCKMYLLAPFRLRLGSPYEEFDELFRQEMLQVKEALRRHDGKAFEDILNESYQKNMVWVICHGGMASTTEDVLRESMSKNNLLAQASGATA